jgi:shikimate kinase
LSHGTTDFCPGRRRKFDNVVVATGGGAPCFYDNMELMNRTGITIFLDIHPEILAKRLITSKTERPLIRGKSTIELENFIGENLQKRRIFYEQSHVRISNPEMNPELIIQLITETIN